MSEGNKKGDTLRGQQIAIEAMKIEYKGKFVRTGAHKGQLAIAERNVYCIIQKEMVKAKD